MMFAIIKDKSSYERYRLEKDISCHGIDIYRKKNIWYLSLKDQLFFDDGTKIKKLEPKRYDIYRDNVFYGIEVAIYQDDEGYEEYGIYENKPFLFSTNPRSQILCQDTYLKDYYLLYKDEALKTNYEVSINGHAYNGYPLSDGDEIDFLGFRFIFFKEFLYINHFKAEVRLQHLKIDPQRISYINRKQVPDYFRPEVEEELVLEKLKPYESQTKPDSAAFLRSLLPNIVMCLSISLMAFISFYKGYEEGEEPLDYIVYLIMPIGMFITGIILPVTLYLVERHRYKINKKKGIDDYLTYLEKYRHDLEKKLADFVNQRNNGFFDLMHASEKMFYATENSKHFMTLSLGKISIAKKLEHEEYVDKEISLKAEEIDNRLSNIEDYPLFLDLKNNKRISIVSKPSSKSYFFYRFLMELSFKHHYDDLHLAIYSADETLFDKVYNLPHLFYGKKRLTLSSHSQLQLLDQMVFDKPVILLAYTQTVFPFSNEKIHIIYFADDNRKLLKNSEAVVEYLNSYGYLYDGKKQRFSYIEEQLDFAKQFAYMGHFNTLDRDRTMTSFISDDIAYSYAHNDHSLRADFAYSRQEPLLFDLHETKQGPHGLIGGSTGSGKSELIVSMLLSLCLRYSPEYLNIVIIDYKGGGIKESLSCKWGTVPHIIASLSNLEDNVLERLIIKISHECKKRQELFKHLGQKCATSIMNLDDYLKNDPKGYGLPLVAHLLLVVDEFAELKKQRPEQIKELISLSRIGRSLGVHLILATQKPGGIIDDEIWSNSRFKIALKVFDEKDSNDIIKSPKAAYLNSPGSFYLKVDDGLMKAQSIYAKADANRRDPYKISLLDNMLSENKTTIFHQNEAVTMAHEYVHKIIETCRMMNLDGTKLVFLPPSPKKRHQLTRPASLALGESDDYLLDQHLILEYSHQDSLLIYTSRRKEINAILNFLNESQRHAIVISDKKYMGIAISDSLNYGDEDDLLYLFNHLLRGNRLDLTLVIEDVACLISYDDRYLELLCKLAKRKESIGISLVFLTSSATLSIKLLSAFENKLVIETSDIGELVSFYFMKSRYMGRSFYFAEEPKSFIPIMIEEYVPSPGCLKEVVRHIPDDIFPESDMEGYLIGYDIQRKEKIMRKDLLISSFSEDLLELYRNAYGDVFTVLDHDLAIREKPFAKILWLGPGIYTQRLFIASVKEELNEDEGVLIEGNRRIIIRRINHVSDIA